GRLDEPDWTRADSLTDFRQREPRVGEPATERTVVKALRDATALYIGVRAYDGESRRIRATQLRRDADLSSDDNVQLLIDSFRDRRSAFVFGTNPNGARWDAQLIDLDNLNENWNGIWDVAVSRDAAGWTAEFRIPFQTLRFRHTAGTDFAQVEADEQVINLTRFPFFFPEKRQFFLESSGLFDFGTPGRTQVFYSRRVGLDSAGNPIPIVAGGRLYGRQGPWRIG